MALFRVYVDAPLSVDDTVSLGTAASHHLSSVLRLHTGDPVVLFNGDGHSYSATLVTTGKKTTAAVTDIKISTAESPVQLHLLQGLSRGDRMDTTVQKAVELGVTSITPVFTQRSSVKLDAKRLQKKQQHWQNIAISACEQSGRCMLPVLHEPRPLKDLLSADHTGPVNRLVMAPGASQRLGQVTISPNAALQILIGPESGLTDDEIKQAVSAGFTAVSLGPRILRTETAGPAVLAILQSRFGDI